MKEYKKKDPIKKKLNNTTIPNKLFQIVYSLLFINLIFIYGCSALKKTEVLNICKSTTLPCLLSTEYVLLITNKGEIKLELYGEKAPITVGNFVDNVEKGAYDKTIFNRVIRKPFPFIIRGGDNNFIDDQTGKIRYIPLEIKLENSSLPIYGKEIDISNKKNNIELKHKRSYISMSRSKKVNSASSQFYISLKSLPELDGRFAVFGKVIRGMNVVELIEEEDFIVEAKRL